MRKDRSFLIPVLLTLLCSLLFRVLVGLHSYSGEGLSPKYGDYEAQRHWMELTVNLPVAEWYVNSTNNDLQYWGLDYPPLTAYQSWLYGKVIQWFDPAAVELHTSRGYETPFSKCLMRWSVIASDVLVLLPAIAAFVLWYYRDKELNEKLWSLLVCACQPPALLIDHGHFQYNNISLGLSVAAAAAVMQDYDILGSALFCLALNHKQMSLYYAPAFFGFLLGKCLRRPTVPSKVWGVLRLGIAVIGTFLLVWLPFLHHSLPTALAVLQRLAPVSRGLYEDYVSNFWCATSLVVKWKRLFSQEQLVKICALATSCAFLPSMVQLIVRPTRTGFLLGMLNCSMAFFLFSYMVHEKSILLPLLPITLLSLEDPLLATWTPPIAALSMFPLLKKDGLELPYAALLLAWLSLHYLRIVPEGHHKHYVSKWKWAWQLLIATSIAMGAAVHVMQLLVSPPERYPFAYDAAYTCIGFVNFFGVWVYGNVRQMGCNTDMPKKYV